MAETVYLIAEMVYLIAEMLYLIAAPYVLNSHLKHLSANRKSCLWESLCQDLITIGAMACQDLILAFSFDSKEKSTSVC